MTFVELDINQFNNPQFRAQFNHEFAVTLSAAAELPVWRVNITGIIVSGY